MIEGYVRNNAGKGRVENQSNQNFRVFLSAVLRGGRMTKHKGETASLSPELGVVVPRTSSEASAGAGALVLTQSLALGIAPAAMLMSSTSAIAQDECVQVNPFEFQCQDNGAPATSVQNINGSDVSVDLQDGFETTETGQLRVVSAGPLVVNQDGGVSSLAGGIYASNSGASGIVITPIDVPSTINPGILAIASGDAQSIVINATGGVVSGSTGIRAEVSGLSGSTSPYVDIITGNVTGLMQDGIAVDMAPNAGSSTIDTTAGVVLGAERGIEVTQNGIGEVSITTADVTGMGSNGIDITGIGGGVVINSTAGSVTGSLAHGIDVRGDGAGDVSITTADVSSTSSNGITVADIAGDIAIDTTVGTVDGGANGVAVSTIGTGPISISTTDVFGRAFDGLFASSANGPVTIDTSNGTVTGLSNAIDVRSLGVGAVSVTTGNAYATNFSGIYISNAGGDVMLDSTAGSVSSDNNGIQINQLGMGSVVITTADVDGGFLNAIDVYSSSGDGITIDTSAGTVIGGVSGIRTRNYGVGATDITLNDVTGTGGQGVRALNIAGADNIAVRGSSGDILGATDGIYVRSAGADITVENLDSVTGQGGDGLDLSSAGGNITVSDIGTISGTGGQGILAVSGGGDVSIQAVGLNGGVSANDRPDPFFDVFSGINVDATGVDGGDINIGGVSAIGDVTADRDALSVGIRAVTGGTGEVVIDSSAGTVAANLIGINVFSGSGDVSVTTGSVTSDTGRGILIYSDSGDISLDSGAGSVTGAGAGIQIDNSGAGDVSVTTADVSSTVSYGIRLVSSATSGAVSVDTTAGAVMGYTSGLSATHRGPEALSITTGDLSGTTNYGLGVRGETGTGNIAIDTSAGTVQGERFGISARGYYGADLSIVTGDVIGNTYSGISTLLIDDNGDLTIDTTTGIVTGAQDGINAANDGTGALRITTAGVEGGTGTGISANANGELTIDTTAGAVSGFTGIRATGRQSGTVSVTTADVTGTGGFGLSASADTGSDGLFVDTTAGVVTGATTGVRANNSLSGNTTVLTGTVTGLDQDGVYSRVTGTGLTIDTTAGAVTGQRHGIYTRNYGIGAVSITTANVTSLGTHAISVRTSTDATDITIDSSAGSLVSNRDGINVANAGSGDLSVATGDVTSQFIGILATGQAGSGDIMIDTTAGMIQSDGVGISANSQGDLSIVTADINSATSTAISAGVGGDQNDLIVDTRAGTIVSEFTSLNLIKADAGSLIVSTGDVESRLGNAILASSDGDVTIDTTAGVVKGVSGILATGSGTGSVSVSTADVIGTNGIGIVASGQSDAESVLVDTSAGTVTGNDGITAVNLGTGPTTIKTADVNATVGNGVYTYHSANGLVIDTTAGTVTGGNRGILAVNSGTGPVEVTTADVSATVGDGMLILSQASGTGVSVDTSGGSVVGVYDGVEVINYGTGSTTVITGNASATLDDGVYARGDGTSLTIDTTAGTVSGAGNGIEALNNGTGDTSITVNDVTSTGAEGIRAENTVSGTSLTVQGSSGDTVGATDGIYLRSLGGVITVENLDSVTGQAGDGLDLASAGGAITVSDIGAITGNGGFGILADSDGGDISIQGVGLLGGVNGVVSSGIDADASGAMGGDITIGGLGAFGNITAQEDGIRAVTDGSGLIAINTTTGSVTGARDAIFVSTRDSSSATITTGDLISTDGNGLTAFNFGNGVSIDASAGSVSSRFIGFRIQNYGLGPIEVTTADVSTDQATGIIVRSYGFASTGITIDSSAGAISAGGGGIETLNFGPGTTNITVGDVTAMNGAGIEARNASPGGDILVSGSSGNVVGSTDGIIIRGANAATFVEDLESVTGQDGHGLDVYSSGSAITIRNIGDISGANGAGISAVTVNGPGGDINIGGGAAIGDVTGSEDGIYAITDSVGSITIDTSLGEVSGGANGISARAYGTGSVAVVSGNVTAMDVDGIFVQSAGGDINVNSSAGTVNANRIGIFAIQNGAGSVSITSGNVTSATSNAIAVQDSADSTGIVINSSQGSLSGAATTIDARHRGTGDIAITTGDVTSTGFSGIFANNTSQGGSIRVDNSSGAVSGTVYGVDARNYGTGDLSITTGSVSTSGTDAVFARNYAFGGSLTIDTSAGALTGRRNGLNAVNYGSGELVVTTADITTQTNLGIFARGEAGSGDVVINTVAGTVTSGSTGISTSHGGDADLTVTTADVNGGINSGISATHSGATGNLNIDTTAGAVTSGNMGIRASLNGSGVLTIITGDVTADNQGISADSTGDIVIDTTAGTITSTDGNDAIVATNFVGEGTTSITTADVTSVSDTGIFVFDTRGDVSIDTSAGTVTGSDGLIAFAAGENSLSVITADVTGTDEEGIVAAVSSSGGNVFVDSSAGSVTAALDGIIISNNGSGTATLISGDVTGKGGIAGIFGRAGDGGLSVNSSAGSVMGAGFGIYALNERSSTLEIVTADVAGTANDGVYALHTGSTVMVDSSAGVVSGGERGIEVLNNGTGSTSLTVNDVTGMSAEGIFAVNSVAGTAIMAQGSSGDVTGATTGVYMRTVGGDITVQNLDGVTGQAGNGLDLASDDGAISMSDIGTIIGIGRNGILINAGAGDVSVQGVGLVGGVTGTGDFGISASGGAIDIGGMAAIGDVTGGVAGISAVSTGSITINTSSGSVTAGTDGIIANPQGSGDVTITTADVMGSTGDGINLVTIADTGSVSIDTSAGTAMGGTNGIDVLHYGRGALAITASEVIGGMNGISILQTGGGTQSINVQDAIGATGAGVSTRSDSNGLSINVTGMAYGLGSGVDARHEGTGNLEITVVDALGVNDAGIFARNGSNSMAGADLVITATGTVEGETGIEAVNNGTGTLSINASDVSGTDDPAIQATNTGTSLTIDTFDGTVAGQFEGIFATNTGSGMTNVTTANIMGVEGDAVNLTTEGTTLSVNTVAGTVTGGGDGMEIAHDGSGLATITTADVFGNDGNGIFASALSGLTIDTTAGLVQGSENGIEVENESGALVLTTANVTGIADDAINAQSNGTTFTINTTAGKVAGRTNGIVVQNTGTGATSIKAADVTGVDGVAIDASSEESTGDLSIVLSGTVMGNEAAIVAENAGTGTTTITSSGMLAATSGEVIRVTGTDADITNDGTIMGFVTLGEGNDTFTNNGEFAATFDSAFGGGSNSFANNGLFAVTSAAPITLTGLGSFANSGMISLVDDQIDNNLTISGDFNGTGDSMLGIDLSFADEVADVLTIEGAATGSTIVGINTLATPSSLMFSDILIVDAGAGSEAGAFALAGGRQTIGLLNFEVAFDASLNDFLIVSVLAEEGLQTTNFAEGARNLSAQSFSVWSSQLSALRDGTGRGSRELSLSGESTTRVWFTASATEISRDRVETFTSGLATTQVDLSYDQDFFGFQGGLDLGSDVLRFGLTGGYLSSQYGFVGSSGRISYDVLNIGAYAALDTGPFFANVLVKYDTIDGDFQGGSGVLDGDADGSTFGVRGEIGALLGERSGFFFEPSASLSWTETNVDDISTVQGDFAFDEDTSITARFGARVGTGIDVNGTSGSIYVGGHYISEFQGDDSVGFASNGGSEQFSARPFGDFGEVRAGINIGDDTSKVSGGFEGHVLFGGDIEGFGGSANIRFRF